MVLHIKLSENHIFQALAAIDFHASPDSAPIFAIQRETLMPALRMLRVMTDAMVSWAWLWVPFTVFAALAQTVRNTAQRSLTAEVGTLSATDRKSVV